MARAFAWARAPALELSIKWPKYREACERSSGFPGVYLSGYIFHGTFSRTFIAPFSYRLRYHLERRVTPYCIVKFSSDRRFFSFVSVSMVANNWQGNKKEPL